MVTTGGELLAVTVTVMVALAVSPRLSVAVAVTTCVPARRLWTVMEAPLPSAPSRSEVHVRLAATLPSSGSCAVAAKVTGAPNMS